MQKVVFTDVDMCVAKNVAETLNASDLVGLAKTDSLFAFRNMLVCKTLEIEGVRSITPALIPHVHKEQPSRVEVNSESYP